MESVASSLQQLIGQRRGKAAANIGATATHIKAKYGKIRKVATNYMVGDLVFWRSGAAKLTDPITSRKLLHKYDGL